jgi:hypothetical protein
MLWAHRLLAHLDNEGLLGFGLCEIMAQPLGKAGPLALKIGHGR